MNSLSVNQTSFSLVLLRNTQVYNVSASNIVIIDYYDTSKLIISMIGSIESLVPKVVKHHSYTNRRRTFRLVTENLIRFCRQFRNIPSPKLFRRERQQFP